MRKRRRICNLVLLLSYPPQKPGNEVVAHADMVPEGFGNFIAKDDLACSRLSDSGEDAKEKGTRFPQFPPVFFFLSCLRFLNSADPTISEPATG